ncbi:MAG: type II toxin-antitoxin system RelE/ParE family toxin [Chloroflexota bacterium]
MADWTVENYVDSRGRSPVENFLNQLPVTDRVRIVHTIGLLADFGLQLGAPYIKHLEGKLWELRIRSRHKVYRILYFAFTGQRFILLHAFLKKTRKTPRQEIGIAQSRLADFLEREEI